MDVMYLDWLGVGCGLAGWYFMPRNERLAMAFLLIGPIAWIVWAIPKQLWSVVFVQFCFWLLYLRMVWTKRLFFL